MKRSIATIAMFAIAFMAYGQGVTGGLAPKGDINLQSGKQYKINGAALSAPDVGAEPSITAGTSSQYWKGDKTWGEPVSDTPRNNGGISAWSNSDKAPCETSIESALQDTAVRLADRASGLTYDSNGKLVTAYAAYDTYTVFLTDFDESLFYVYDKTGRHACQKSTSTITDSYYKFGSNSLNVLDGYVTMADSDDWHFGTSDFTVEFWFYIGSQPSIQRYFLQQGTDSNVGWELGHDGTNLYFKYSYDGSTVNTLSAAQSITTSAWHNVMVSRSSGTLKLFYDGVAKADASAAGSFFNSTAALTINVYGYSFYGLMDEIRISKSVARQTADYTVATSAYALMQDYRLSALAYTSNYGLQVPNNVDIASGKTYNIDGSPHTHSYVPLITSTDNAIARFDGTTGALQNSGVIVDDSNNVGIGTTSPSAKLDICDSQAANVGMRVYHNSVSQAANYFPFLQFDHTPMGQSYINSVFIRQANSPTGGNVPSLKISTKYSSDSEIDRLFLDGHTGYFGIGTTSPSYLTHIKGATPTLCIDNSSASSSGVNTLLFTGLDGNSNQRDVVKIIGEQAGNGGYGQLRVQTAFNNTLYDRVTVTKDGNVGIGTTSPTPTTSGSLDVHGYTCLGDGAPAIKIKKLTGTTASSEGTATSIAHGITASKIISISGLVFYAASTAVPPGYTNTAGYEYYISATSSNIDVENHATNSENILSKALTITIIYEE